MPCFLPSVLRTHTVSGFQLEVKKAMDKEMMGGGGGRGGAGGGRGGGRGRGAPRGGGRGAPGGGRGGERICVLLSPIFIPDVVSQELTCLFYWNYTVS